jgi:peptidoglycan/xylan/chitin deacetylase (PgdA/CDA1 family)
MSKNELNVLRDEGHHLGFHSISHANLTDCSAPQLEQEILSGAKKTSLDLGYEFDFFAYPRGKFNESMFPYIEKAGFKYAFTTKPGNVVDVSGINKFKIPRNPVVKKYFRWL